MESLDHRIAQRLKRARRDQGLTLDDLAARTGVSRAMISRIERRQSSPTAALLGRLCAGLGMAPAALMTTVDGGPAAILTRADQPVWRDPATGYVRRAVSPSGGALPVEVTRVSLPPGARVDYPPLPGHEQAVYLLSGRLDFQVGDWRAELAAGDGARARLDADHFLHNPGTAPADYLVILGRIMS